MDEESIFLKAVEARSAAERAALLERECGGNVALRGRVEQLLRSHDDAGSFLEKPPAGAAQEHTALMTGDTDGPTHGDANLGGATQGAPTQLERTVQLEGGEDDVSLDFLHPSGKPGVRGTIGLYEVQSVVGRGGMGLVLKALDTRLNRTVAVKVLAPQLAANATARKRFVREAQAAAAVTHPHVVTIHAVDEDKVPYLVMEMVSGRSLRDKIEAQGSLELKEILRIGSQIASGLAAAHRQGLIHRDIKPANILLENGVERVKITDFGLARAVDDLSVTRTGEVAGTPQFMSPEQAQGEHMDHRGDLFSLGSVLYTMCTGRPPFRGDSPLAVIRRVVDDIPRPIRDVNPDVPAWLCDIIDRLMAKNPDDRFQKASEVAALLEQHLAHVQHPTTFPPPAAAPPSSSSDATIPFGQLPAASSTGGAGNASPATSPWEAPPRHRRSLLWTTAIFAGALLVLAGIIITIRNRDGSTTKIEVADGASVTIQDTNGPAEVPLTSFDAFSISQTLSNLRGQPGKVLYFDLVGSNNGSLWGSEVYTDDSNLQAAAVHAGVLKAGERGIVKVTILEGKPGYAGVERNGIRSNSWSSHPGSFRIELARAGKDSGPPAGVLPDPGTLWVHRDEVGKTLMFETIGRTRGAVYGTDLYTNDSDLGTAAVHAGFLQNGQRGVVSVTILKGEASYTGSQRNGVQSANWGEWNGSYRIKAVKAAASPSEPKFDPAKETVHLPVTPFTGYVTSYRGHVGRAFYFEVTGAVDGRTVFGTDLYSDDSGLAQAAVHAGVLKAAETGIVKVTIKPGSRDYVGSTRNGVTTDRWSAWEGSFTVESAKGPFVNLPALRDKVGQSMIAQVIGSARGPCYGTDVYSDDSDLATAAVHAGVLKAGEEGYVRVTIAGPQKSLLGTVRNGVTSQAYPDWPGSFRVEPATNKPPGGAARVDKKSPPLALAPFDPRQAATVRTPVDMNGTWSSDWGDVVLIHPPAEGDKPFDVNGTFTSGRGLILGTVDPKTRTLKGTFQEKGGPSGILRFVVSADNSQITGHYGYTHLQQPVDAFRWDMKRTTPPRNANAAKEKPARIVFEGKWASSFGDVDLSHPPATGDRPFAVKGTYYAGMGVIEGTVDPKTRTLNGTFRETTGMSGKLRLVLSSDNLRIVGHYGYKQTNGFDPIDKYGWDMARLTPLPDDRAKSAPKNAQPDEPARAEMPEELAPPGAAVPFDPQQALAHQTAWAKFLGVSVERTNSVGMKFRLVPPGEFVMGTDPRIHPTLIAERDWYFTKWIDERRRAEEPSGPVRLSRPMYLGIHEVTVGQFRQFVESSGYKTEAEQSEGFGWAGGEWKRDGSFSWKNPGFPQADNHPVCNVSWNDAVAFCRWLSAKEGVYCRLPTEAEWEYACRAGTTSQFQGGDDASSLQGRANVADESLRDAEPSVAWASRWTDRHALTAPVGSFQPNAFGLFDMHGNATEWCQDYYDENAYSKERGIDPHGPAKGEEHVFRGGSFDSWAGFCRSADRYGSHSPTLRTRWAGFRVVISGDLRNSTAKP